MRPAGANFEAEDKFKVRRIYFLRGHSPAGQGMHGSNPKSLGEIFGLPVRLPCSFGNRKKRKKRELLPFLNDSQYSNWAGLNRECPAFAIQVLYCHQLFMGKESHLIALIG
ncbi:hypothetical protein [Proteiniphilum propionicum]|uniref:hypothetical protein n=1 Tax=Proteiniphilum propionicum TaxID=2829812 RepID=UPI001EEB8612|nr:hypothetical protein [Proteiniphilum propionicum]MDD4754380.1 hypothetical protein [Desulfitobacteriaceae bacterium]ULB35457.1 hypothetical protein KDN43_05315 [Proteiniphilum propionicum]